MEEDLPRRPFTDEWKHLPHDERRWRDRYRALSWSEARVPWLFAATYLVALVVFVWPALRPSEPIAA